MAERAQSSYEADRRRPSDHGQNANVTQRCTMASSVAFASLAARALSPVLQSRTPGDMRKRPRSAQCVDPLPNASAAHTRHIVLGPGGTTKRFVARSQASTTVGATKTTGGPRIARQKSRQTTSRGPRNGHEPQGEATGLVAPREALVDSRNDVSGSETAAADKFTQASEEAFLNGIAKTTKQEEIEDRTRGSPKGRTKSGKYKQEGKARRKPTQNTKASEGGATSRPRQKPKFRKKARSAKSNRSSDNGSVADAQDSRRPQYTDPFAEYMESISWPGLLNQEQVTELAHTIKKGIRVEDAQKTMTKSLSRRPTVIELAAYLKTDPSEVQRSIAAGNVAKNDLVSANLRLVSSVATKIQSSKSTSAGIPLDDLIQEGSLGLIRAAEKFDASRGYRFSTYATWWVRASILRAITTQSRVIKLPSSVIEDHARIEKERERQKKQGVFNPSDSELAHALGMTVAKLRFVVSSATRHMASLDISVSSEGVDGGAKALVELIPGDEEIEERMVEDMQKRELDVTLKRTLKPIERAVVRLRFGLDDGHPRTLREVGELLSISKERVRQLVFGSLSKLKTPEVKTALVDFLS